MMRGGVMMRLLAAWRNTSYRPPQRAAVDQIVPAPGRPHRGHAIHITTSQQAASGGRASSQGGQQRTSTIGSIHQAIALQRRSANCA